jgi:hypothetical protein
MFDVLARKVFKDYLKSHSIMYLVFYGFGGGSQTSTNV